ncbi:class I SAM-dependent methyltransferase [Streptomyces sp. ISL-100]|uniref:class I SAM-dependent methyltransferase n=1 Tax=Streptomyces sp. ISL-100 TaxID=2819173 RepID=UPI001BE5C36D|nr:class I SAM-dependent methyltransferase [Streptomyces sp. ISL-100]MBT2398202.1 methyltransferase domain-containing protein [Streptomyces sp. ISL-100]
MVSGTTLPADPSNAEQARAWDGEQGAYWAAHADQFDRAVGAYQPRFLAAAAIGAGERVLDIGCGTGESARAAAHLAVDGSVLGVDLSGEMLRVARRKAAGEGLGNVRFEQADAQTYPFPDGEFDVAISRSGSMFFAEPVRAFRNIARALRPGGRLVLLVWQAPSRNAWFRAFATAMAAGRPLPVPAPGTPGPFSMADPDEVRARLTAAAFTEPRFEDLSAPMHFGPDAGRAYPFVSGLLGWMLDGLDDSGRRRALTDLRASLDAHETPSGVLYESAAWLVTAGLSRRASAIAAP